MNTEALQWPTCPICGIWFTTMDCTCPRCSSAPVMKDVVRLEMMVVSTASTTTCAKTAGEP